MECRPATPYEIVQVAHGIRSARIEGKEGLKAAKTDLYRTRVMLDGESMSDLIQEGRIREVLLHIKSRDSGNAT